MLPEPASVVGVFVPYDVEVPYSTYHVVGSPFGFTVPPSVAVVGPTPVAGAVTATGGDAVVKSPSAPFVRRGRVLRDEPVVVGRRGD